MKKHILTTILLSAALIMTGCGAASNSGTSSNGEASNTAISTTEDTEENNTSGTPSRIAAEAPTSYVTEEMLAEATDFANINYARLRDVMLRAEAGEDITIGVIGGSITQGSSATSKEKSYAQIMKTWWETTFPDAKITYVNAGVGGTDSYFGVHRMDKDLLEYEPDFCIVEFSVNDSNDNAHKRSYENVVRRILVQENDPAVLLLYMTMEDGTSAQSNDAMVGFYYNLPQISYHDTIMARMKAGDLAWKEISPDNIHPNDYGHAICGELIWKYLNGVYERLDEIEDTYTVPPTAMTSEMYMNATILDSTELTADESEGFAEGSVNWVEYDKGWSCEDGGSITFTVNAARIGVLYYKSVSGTYGTADVLVDGEHCYALVGDFSGGWGNYGLAESVFSGQEKAEHTLTIEVPEGKQFQILGILIAE
jgi:lysophospholipase L1-like esterase/uncharacterized protein YceK